MSDQAQRIKKNAWAIVVCIWFIGGGLLFWSMWNWSPKPEQDDRRGFVKNNWMRPPEPSQSIQPGLPVQPGLPTQPAILPAQPAATANNRVSPTMSLGVEERPGEGIVVVVILNNTAAAPIFLPETGARDPLYKITLKYNPGNNKPFMELPAKSTMPYSPGVAQAVLFDFERDQNIILEPGNSHVLTIPLKNEYDLAPGKYELTVRLQPDHIFPTGRSPKLPKFNAGPAMASTTFELPLTGAAKPKLEEAEPKNP
jgi:hypothetical protein